MHTASSFILPLTNPTLIFAVVLLVILFSPLLLNRLRVPPLIGLILAGIALGPYGFNVLANDESFLLFGNVGLLYIVFMAGIAVEISNFRKNLIKGGFLAFVSITVALALALFAGTVFLHFSTATSVLLAGMFASQTLVAYQVINRFGLGARQPVRVATVSSILTVTVSLILLTIVSDKLALLSGWSSWLLEIGKLLLFVGIIFWAFPKIAHSFFKRFDDSILQYIFVLSLVFFGAFIAQIAGLEDVVGAFLVGVAINRLVPKISSLMDRLEFVGTALFIPFFLISVGMVINFRVLRNGMESIVVILAMVAIPIITKWIAAGTTRLVFSVDKNESQMMFGLINGQAGITLALMAIGYTIMLPDGSRLLPDSVMMGAVVMILVSGTVSIWVTETASRKIVARGVRQPENNSANQEQRRERIMFTVANPHTLDHLVDLSLAIKNPKSKEDLYALRVITDKDEARQEEGDLLLQQAAKVASVSDQWVERISRYDVNVASGILYAAKENAVTEIVIGLHQKLKSRDTFFGLMTEMLLKGARCSLYIYKPAFKLKQTARLVVFLPRKAELEAGFVRCFTHVANIARGLNIPLMVYSTPETRAVVMHRRSLRQRVSIDFFLYHSVKELSPLIAQVMDKDMCIFFVTRAKTISFDENFDALVADFVAADNEHNVLVVYPEQYEKQENVDERFYVLHQPHYKFEQIRRSERWLLIQLKRAWNRIFK